ncbi:putative pectinesterase/pectinesterase inhibitor 17 [Cardamine amara subsp. amara]|uniref:Pectinesterase/pectinesterase inhibitor 17 n=1 Tax=Cardamine amara subsp. amara TaxID=228776 RepID=A0ABD1B594_CARAN
MLLTSTAGNNAPESAFVIMAKDGSGQFKTINEGISAASGSGRLVIYVKQGVYYEYLNIQKPNVMLRDDGKGNTIITGSRSFQGGTHTFNLATVDTYG